MRLFSQLLLTALKGLVVGALLAVGFLMLVAWLMRR